MKDNHKKWHETLHYKERGDWDWVEGNVPSSGPGLVPTDHNNGPGSLCIKALRGKSERNAEGAVG